MKKDTMKSDLQTDVLFYFPSSYEQRRALHRNFFKQSYLYVFQIFVRSMKIVDKKVFISATVFEKKITIMHSYKFARFFRKGVLQICGNLKYEATEDIFDELYDPTKGDEYDSDLQEEIGMISEESAFNTEYRWNRGWSYKRIPRLFCFFPEIFDLRIGLVAKYSKLKPLEVKNMKCYIEEKAPSFLKNLLLKIHEPNNIIELNLSLKKLFVIEVACFLKGINKKIYNAPMLKSLECNLNIELTDSQEKAVEEICQELSNSCRMSRVLYGDVGSGKTIVAILASLKCIQNGKNVLYLVPTQLLAKQINLNFKKFVPEISTMLLLGKNSIIPIKEPIVFIGTHTLLWKDFDNVGLVIVDEQHKFGVEQRHTLTKDNNLLMMTATMIPRTFQMVLLGNLSFSFLEKRKDTGETETFVASMSEWSNLFNDILKIAHYQKIIWVSSTIEDAQRNYNLAQNREDINTFLIHGKVKDKDLILNSFDQSGEGILFSTIVIEVGIDINLNYIVIENADSFGLAQLHQIRGRVGRGEQSGKCILIGNNMEKLYEIQKAKTGFEISRLDLSNRGFGLLQDNLQAGFESFIFAKYWHEKRWHIHPLNEEIISNAKSIDQDFLSHEICNLFFEGYSLKLKI